MDFFVKDGIEAYSRIHSDMRIVLDSFTVRRHASVVFAVVVCLSVCLSQVGVPLKWLSVASHTDAVRYPRDCSFLMLKISAKFKRVTPYRGAKCRWDRLKLAIFDE